MTKWGIKRGFTLVELLIVVAILAVLSSAAYIGIQRAQVRVMNEKVLDDLAAISNALEQYKQDEGSYPTVPDPLETGLDKNVNCFNADTTYAHDCTTADFIQTQVDNLLLTKRYLQEVPTDPRTQSRYMYGVTTDGQFFQVAGNYLDENDMWIAKVQGNVEKGYSLPSLIRAFDGRNFVMDGEGYLPYSPDHMSLTATLSEIRGGVRVNGNIVTNSSSAEEKVAQPDSIIEVDPNGQVAIYFSDGSMTYLDGEGSGAQLRILPETEVEQNDKDGIITKIRLKLFSGKIWNKVARLAAESEFNVETTTAIAGVRGTEFGIDAIGSSLIVLSGSVAIRQKSQSELDLTNGIEAYIAPEDFEFENAQIATGNGTDFQTFYMPEAEVNSAPAAGAKIEGQDKEELLNQYYSGAFNNNYRPRILEVNTMVPNAEKIEFAYLDGVRKISATDVTGNNVLKSWEGTDIEVAPGDTKLTVRPDMSTVPFISGKLVRFYFHSMEGDKVTGLSTPAVFVGPQLKLTQEDIYNLGGQESSLNESNPIIVSIQNVELGGETTIIADIPCDWSVVNGGGAVKTPNTNVQNVIYESISSALNMDNRILNASSRFANTPAETVAIRCSKPGNPSKFDEKILQVSYAPVKTSGLSGYDYSWFAKGSVGWLEAKALCVGYANIPPTEQNILSGQGYLPTDFPGLTEGGVPVGTWKLPSQTVYDNLDPTPDKTNPAEGVFWCGNWTGNDCSDMPDGVASIWLEEEDQNNNTKGYNILGNALGIIASAPKNDNNAFRGFRCIKQ